MGGRRSGRDRNRSTARVLRAGFDLGADTWLATAETLPPTFTAGLDSPQPQATASSATTVPTASETRSTHAIIVTVLADIADFGTVLVELAFPYRARSGESQATSAFGLDGKIAALLRVHPDGGLEALSCS